MPDENEKPAGRKESWWRTLLNEQPQPTPQDPKRLVALSGYGLLAAAASILLTKALSGGHRLRDLPAPDPQENIPVWVLRYFGDELFALIGAILLAFVGFRLLGIAGKITPRVIPDEDRALLEPLVGTANADAITQYVRLSSLRGFTGNFQHIGFTGLPLATVALTLVFAALSFAKPEFLEFAKLTLGAFIGSFVQRSSDVTRIAELKLNSIRPSSLDSPESVQPNLAFSSGGRTDGVEPTASNESDDLAGARKKPEGT